MDKFEYLGNADGALIEGLYDQYLKDPESVEFGWRKFFEGFEFSKENYDHPVQDKHVLPDEFKVINLINAYRQRGHLFTETNPVRVRRKYSPTLDIENFGLQEKDLKRVFKAGNEIGIGNATLQEIIDHLDQTYCRSVGVEYMFIRTPIIVEWLKGKMDETRNTPKFNHEEKKHILEKLGEAVLFEKFVHKKFTGQKRFSLEGAESMIPALDAIIEKGAEMGVEEFVIGMAHRGRLNVLANILQKSYEQIFTEFEGVEYKDQSLLGDVKYHLGYSANVNTRKGENAHITLAPNPSHLEAVDPVVQGIVRAKIDQDFNGDYNKVAPVLIHGDASIAGQGVVYEVVQMSELEGYKTGGTIHIVINNQIGFTTNYLEGRSSTYCTDIAKILHTPIFHVNADDVEAVVYTMRLAMEYRQVFKKDVFIDLLGYRKYGHNESDEPRFTQPILYKTIERHPNPRDIYIKKLLNEGIIKEAEAKELATSFNTVLEEDLTASKQVEKTTITSFLEENWKNIRKAVPDDFIDSPVTGVDKEVLLSITDKLTSVPEDKKLFRKIIKLQNDRRKLVLENEQVDWAMGELLAYGSLVYEGIPVRLSGQDSERGTFSHRHAVLRIEDSEEKYTPLKNIKPEQAKFDVYNSPLSEYGVLGFEYGYSLATPQTLTIWEAQFGDFFNGAQIIYDQFLSSAEDKWNVMNDLVILLPHGYEGQGPEHSSARIERFLSLCAENNMQLVNATTPANFFHVLRRQLKRDFRKPLIIFTPKSLLRHPKCVSSVDELAEGGFKEVIDDTVDPDKVKRLVFCSGKVYYDLLEEREKRGVDHIAFVRIEQIYPFPHEQVKQVLTKYSNATVHLWVQEEPFNMGVWPFLYQEFREVNLKLVARPASGSPATGSSKFHKVRQRKIIEKTFEDCHCTNLQESCKMICAGNDITNDVFPVNLKIKEYR